MVVEGSGPRARWRWRRGLQKSVSSREGGVGGAREEKWSLTSTVEEAGTRMPVGDDVMRRRASLVVRFRPVVIDHLILLLLPATRKEMKVAQDVPDSRR